MKSHVALAAAFASLASSPGTAAELGPLKPSAPWNIQYSGNLCTLVREFGSGDEKVLLVFRPAMFSDQTRLTVIRNASSGAMRTGFAKLSLDGNAPVEAPFIEGFSKAEGVSAIAIDYDESKLSALGTAKIFRIQAGKTDITLAPTAVPAAMKALDTCKKDLLVKWGMDAVVVASIATFPTVPGGILRLFNTNDYPMSAIRNNEQGTVGVRFWVSEIGEVSNCQIVESSGSRELDSQTCTIITKRSHFEPARTKSGEPVKSLGFQRIRWVLPS